MEKVSINTEYIKISQLLKLSGIIGQGSDAKQLIANGLVKLNGAVVSERGKKVRPGDKVTVDGMGSIEVTEAIEE